MRYYLHRQNTVFGRIQNWIAISRFKHEVSIGRIERVAPDRVQVECIHCGKQLSAEYGLALPAKLTR